MMDKSEILVNEMWMLVLFTWFLNTSPTKSDLERWCTSATELRGPDPQGYCGQVIHEILSLVCNGRYAMPYVRKRDSVEFSGFYDYKASIGQFPMFSPLQDLLISKKRATSYLFPTDSQNIVCECCYHQCQPAELEQYCE